jgi:MraZ protein
VARFFGRHEHSLDAKGRVILPAKFRAPFEHGGYLSQYRDGCLALWTPEEFEQQLAQLQEAQGEGKAQRNRARVFAAGSQEVEVDRSGRMPIAPHLREFAQLASEAPVLILGAIDRVELWAPEQWSEKVAPSEAALTDEED